MENKRRRNVRPDTKRFSLKVLFLGNLAFLLVLRQLFHFDPNVSAVLSGFGLGVGVMGLLTLIREKDEVTKFLEEAER